MTKKLLAWERVSSLSRSLALERWQLLPAEPGRAAALQGQGDLECPGAQLEQEQRGCSGLWVGSSTWIFTPTRTNPLPRCESSGGSVLHKVSSSLAESGRRSIPGHGVDLLLHMLTPRAGSLPCSCFPAWSCPMLQPQMLVLLAARFTESPGRTNSAFPT